MIETITQYNPLKPKIFKVLTLADRNSSTYLCFLQHNLMLDTTVSSN